MQLVLHKAQTRGHAKHGWLDSHHSFSFADYYDPERMNFGVMRVLNDDIVAGASGFDTHPHHNMEIISIPLEGDLKHEDSMGHADVIKQGDIQAMSAGTGITHSEYNANMDKPVKFLQIWIMPNQQGVTPRYDQMTLDASSLHNTFSQILSPNENDDGIWIHQNAWFYLGEFDQQTDYRHHLKNHEHNGLYVFMIDGKARIENESLDKRDGYGIWETEAVDITAEPGSKILLMDIPMA